MIHDLRESARERYAGDLGALPLSNAPEPVTQRAWPTSSLGGGQDQSSPQETVPFLTDMAGVDVVARCPDTGHESGIIGHVFRTRKATDVA